MLISFLFLSFQAAASPDACRLAFNDMSFGREVDRLADLKSEIEFARSRNKTANSKALESAYAEKKASLLVHLKSLGLSESYLDEALRTATQSSHPNGSRRREETSSEERRERERSLLPDFNEYAMRFGKVTPGHFVYSLESPNPADPDDTLRSWISRVGHAYELGTTEVSVYVWNEVTTAAWKLDRANYKALPKLLRQADDAPARPLVQTAISISLWIKALNRLVSVNDPVIRVILPDHRPGTIYRLPYEAEWALVANRRSNKALALEDLWPDMKVRVGLDLGPGLHASVNGQKAFRFENVDYHFLYGNDQLMADSGHEIVRPDLVEVTHNGQGRLLAGNVVETHDSRLHHRRLSVSDEATLTNVSFRLVRVLKPD